MINKYQADYGGANLTAPNAAILAFFATANGSLKTIRVMIPSAITGACVWNVSKNGTDLLTTELTIAAGQKIVSFTPSSAIAVLLGDVFVFKLVTIPAGQNIPAPAALQFETDENAIFSAADQAALATALSLSGTNTGDETSSTIKTKLGISILSGVNTGDETATSIGNLINSLTAKSTPVDTDQFGLMDSTDTILKKFSWFNLKAKLKNYFDSIYQAVLVSGTNIKTINSVSLLGSGDIVVSSSASDASLTTSDITTNNVSTLKHGFAPKLPNDPAKYLNGAGAYTVPAAGGASYDGGRPTNPYNIFYDFCDFLPGEVGNGANSDTNRWGARNGTAGTGVPDPANSAVYNNVSGNRLGVVRIPGSGATMSFLAMQGKVINAQNARVINSDSFFDVVFIASTSDAAGKYFRVGLIEDPSSRLFNTGIFLLSDPAQVSTIVGACRNSGTDTVTASLKTLVANTFYKFRVRRINSTTVGFQINDETEVTQTSNIPANTPLTPALQVGSNAGNVINIDVDCAEVLVTGMTRY